MKKRSPIDIINELTDLIAELNWIIAIPGDQALAEGDPRGAIIGSPEFCADVAKSHWGQDIDIIDPNASEYEDMIIMEESTNEETKLDTTKTTKKKTELH